MHYINGQFQVKVIEHTRVRLPWPLSKFVKIPDLITLQLVYPRFIHAEFMTHRVFSRNASSSRAIPVAKMIDQVRTDPAMPVHWGKNQAGMQAREENDELITVPEQLHAAYEHFCTKGAVLPKPQRAPREFWWQFLAWVQSLGAEAFADAAYHKQVANRVLEPAQLISVIVTSTEWSNFFELRDHPDAQPEIQVLAQLMKRAIDESEPRMVDWLASPKLASSWHLPYVTALDRQVLDTAVLLKLSTARCARVSYKNHDGTVPLIDKDVALHDDLVGGSPLHASPTEHQARPTLKFWRCANFKRWEQYRRTCEERVFRKR
jgi:thymidylate synthase ThyX